ncbi:hypothetical protein SDC9_108345 [bioreactor metagenome]|uniref:Uncharacterized protein n=1 Tax=bioreactor metagenome TaxID=1076179 RepID=A0A645B7T9_9ZZZZ
MRGGCDHVRVGHGGGVQPGGHQPRDMGHIHHQEGAHGVRDPAEAFKVDQAGIGGGAGHDHARPVLQRQGFQRVVVYGFGLFF